MVVKQNSDAILSNNGWTMRSISECTKMLTLSFLGGTTSATGTLAAEEIVEQDHVPKLIKYIWNDWHLVKQPKSLFRVRRKSHRSGNKVRSRA
jgi:hypothetical protein